MGPVVIEAQVKPDGSMSVVEDRTFDFDGDFTRVYWDLATKGGQAITVHRRRGDRRPGSATPLAPTTRRRPTTTDRPAPTRRATSARDDLGRTRTSASPTSRRRSGSTYDVTGAAQRYRTPPSCTGSSSARSGTVPASDVSIDDQAPGPAHQGRGAGVGARPAHRHGRDRRRRRRDPHASPEVPAEHLRRGPRPVSRDRAPGSARHRPAAQADGPGRGGEAGRRGQRRRA